MPSGAKERGACTKYSPGSSVAALNMTESLFEWFDPLSVNLARYRCALFISIVRATMTHAPPRANSCESLIASHDGINAMTAENEVIQLASCTKPLRLQRQFSSARAGLRRRSRHGAEPRSTNTFV
jgi:hypothetical protein